MDEPTHRPTHITPEDVWSWIIAAALACGASFATATVGTCLVLVMMPARGSEAVFYKTLQFGVFVTVGFVGVVVGSLRLKPERRGLGSMILLVAGLLFYGFLWGATESLESHNSNLPALPALLVGGLCAVVLMRKKAANKPVEQTGARRLDSDTTKKMNDDRGA
jgi:hypothetical protein